jgi:hypothetical protein
VDQAQTLVFGMNPHDHSFQCELRRRDGSIEIHRNISTREELASLESTRYVGIYVLWVGDNLNAYGAYEAAAELYYGTVDKAR